MFALETATTIRERRFLGPEASADGNSFGLIMPTGSECFDQLKVLDLELLRCGPEGLLLYIGGIGVGAG